MSFLVSFFPPLTTGQRNMAARRIAQETFDAVLQEKANRYHMDPSGEAVGEALQFKAQGELKCLVSLGGG